MIRDLTACGSSVNEMTKVWYLLNTLPHLYDGVITAVKTMSHDCLTLVFVKKLLLEHEQKLKKESADTITKAVQFKTTATRRTSTWKRIKPNYSRKQTSQKWFFCGSRNHVERDCYYYKQYMSRQDRQESRGPKKLRKSRDAPELMTAACDAAPEEENIFAPILHTGSANEDRAREHQLKCVMDSGATEHIINDMGFYKGYKQLEKPIKISVAKKKSRIWAAHVGNIEVMTNLGHMRVIKDVLYAHEVPLNLLSVKMQEAGFSVIFTSDGSSTKRP